MSKNEKTSKKIATIAAKGLKSPEKLTKAEIKALAASAPASREPRYKPIPYASRLAVWSEK